MSEQPRQPRVFSQARLLISGGVICTVISFLATYGAVASYQDGSGSVGGIVAVVLFDLFSLTILAQGFWRRFGVDEDKVWTRFGKLFYREVRFDQVTRFKTGFNRYKLSDGRTVVNLDYNRFDYILAMERLAEELSRRQFDLPEANVGDTNWQAEAQFWRRYFIAEVYQRFAAYYNRHPDEYARLQRIAPGFEQALNA